MKPDYKAWAEALESGKYKQGRICLRDKEDLYCCLGVLCEISGVAKKLDIINADIHLDGREVYHYGDINVQFSKLPYNLFEGLDWFGKFPYPLKFSKNYSDVVAKNLATLNDNGISFKDIATVIRIQFLGENLPYPKGLNP